MDPEAGIMVGGRFLPGEVDDGSGLDDDGFPHGSAGEDLQSLADCLEHVSKLPLASNIPAIEIHPDLVKATGVDEFLELVVEHTEIPLGLSGFTVGAKRRLAAPSFVFLLGDGVDLDCPTVIILVSVFFQLKARGRSLDPILLTKDLCNPLGLELGLEFAINWMGHFLTPRSKTGSKVVRNV
jgi:hypothetical protein